MWMPVGRQVFPEDLEEAAEMLAEKYLILTKKFQRKKEVHMLIVKWRNINNLSSQIKPV